jgi:uncharacterized protein YdhG (YjbR/CyaY superfamily)
MKKAQGKKRQTATKPKMRKVPKSAEDYLAAVPETSRANFDKLRAVVRAAVPKEATETISYGILAYKHNGVLVWIAAFSKHCSLFPTAAVVELFKKELKGFSTSKGTIHFPSDKPLPVSLIKKLVKERVAQNEKKKQR